MRLSSTSHRLYFGFVAMALTAVFSAVPARPAVSACGGTPEVTTDKPDYGPTEVVVISGSGFQCGELLSVVVTAPDGTTRSGDGAGSPGPDTVITDENGAFSLSYHLSGNLPGGDSYEGQLGRYGVSVQNESGTVVETTAFGDAFGYFSCVLTTTGGVKCWGDNSHGQLGNGTFNTSAPYGSATPMDVSGLISGVSQVTAGYLHACALTTSGGVKCWGYNFYGQLGNGTFNTSAPYGSATPVDVSGLTSGVVQIKAGGFITCAVLVSGGVKCWGRNEFGGLGNGTMTTSPPFGIATPVDVTGLTSGVAEVSVGNLHACALTTSGGVKCWGYNRYGGLGNGTVVFNPPYGIATPVNVIGLTSGAAQVKSGGYTTCAVATGGGAKCWGYNLYGGLGNGTFTLSPPFGVATPVNVTGLASGVSEIAPGFYHTCALMTSGGVKCWGYNELGSLGNTVFTTSSPWGIATPVDVSGLMSGVSQIASGFYHSCALMTSGGAKCWGYNFYGQLGNGMFTTSPPWGSASPGTVSGLTSGVAQLWDSDALFTADSNPPTSSPTQTPAANSTGWNNTDVLVTWNWDDGEGAGVDTANCTANSTSSGESSAIGLNASCKDLASNTGNASYNVMVDKTKPTIAAAVASPPNALGWYNDDVIVEFTCADTLSGIDGCPDDETLSTEGSAVTSTVTTSIDVAGNISDPSNAVTVKIDKTLPTIGAAATTSPNGAGWYNGNVTVTFSCADVLSGIPTSTCPTDQTLSAEGAAIASTAQSVADVAGNTSVPSNVVTAKIDKSAPTISAAATTTPNAFGWYQNNVTVVFTCADALSGIPTCPASQTLSTEGTAVASTAQVVSDAAGHTSVPSNLVTVKIDKTLPLVTLDGGPAHGGSYYFGAVPPTPTCSASDGLSGLQGSCAVSGYGTTVGSHTVTATAIDKAGNQSSTSVTYAVLSWTFAGFYQPVDMGEVVNTVRNGSTVPIKFEVFAGSTELMDTSVVVQPLTATQTLCSGGLEDQIELTATGGTSLRYDATGGQFIYNWQTPKMAGYCYVVTVVLTDGTSRIAKFRLR